MSIKLNLIFLSFLLFCVIAVAAFRAPNFREEQQKFPRVRAAYNEKEADVEKLLASKKISMGKMNLLICVFKTEGVLEVWAKEATQKKYSKIKEYAICKSSGVPGPKRTAGDGQVPEGFYHIDRYNPSSNFYLSLGLNYPNVSDEIISQGVSKGGDIFIHGNCVSIGCIPITDNYIKEVYMMAVEARTNGQYKIPVYIFPTRMTKENMARLTASVKNKATLHFWSNIQKGYDNFESTHAEINYSILDNGDYDFAE